jgi:hypothetical protein
MTTTGTGCTEANFAIRVARVTPSIISIRPSGSYSLFPVLRGEGWGEGSRTVRLLTAAGCRKVLDPSPPPFHLAISANENRSTGERE